jgi:hypothetical protein
MEISKRENERNAKSLRGTASLRKRLRLNCAEKVSTESYGKQIVKLKIRKIWNQIKRAEFKIGIMLRILNKLEKSEKS